MNKYYAIKSTSGEYLALRNNDRYGTVDVGKSELDVFTAQDILFLNQKEAMEELDSIKEDDSYNLAHEVQVEGIVELEVDFNYKEISKF